MKLIKINKINFNYYRNLDNIIVYKHNQIIFLLLVFFTLISIILLYVYFCLLIINYYLINEDLSFTLTLSQNTEVSIKTEMSINKVCVFNPFIDLFHKNNSTYRYFPNYFIPIQYNLSETSVSNPSYNDSEIIKIILCEQINGLQIINNNWAKLYSDLCCLVMEYTNSGTI